MMEAFLVQLGWVVVCGIAIYIMLWRAQRRWEAEDKQFWEQMECKVAYTPLPLPSAKLDVPTGLSDATRALVNTPSPALEAAIAKLDATAASGVTDEDFDDSQPPAESAPSTPRASIDLGDLANRLSEAGYEGETLRLSGVEFPSERHVVVHLEAQGP